MQIFDLKLALYGQIYDSEGLLYSYPEKITHLRASGQYPAWINALQSDSRFLRELVNPGGECFSVRYGQEGLFYSYTKFNPHDSRNGVVSIALYTKDKAVSNAQQLVNVLRNLMDYFLEKNSAIGIMDADVESLLKDLSNPYMIGLPSAVEASPSQDAYRIFQTEEELQKYLYCSIQKEYTRYKWVHFISASNRKTVINPTLYLELNSRVAECFVIKRTDGYELASSGTNCSFTFTKEGYLPQKVNFIVGQSSPYVTVDANNMIHVRPMNELHLTFKKRIKILLFDESTNMPIVEDGIQVSFTEELTENMPKRVVLSANGYQRKTITLDPSKMTTAEGSLRQTLQRDVQDFNPKPDNQSYGWGEDDQQDNSISLNKNILIVCLIAAFVIGAGIGFITQKYIPSETSADASVMATKDSIIKVLQDSINRIDKPQSSTLEQINTLCSDTVRLNKQIKDLHGKVNQKDKQIKDLQGQANIEKKALDYLQTHNKWCLQELKNASDDKNKYYDALNTLLTTKKYDLEETLTILAPVIFKNKEWENVVYEIIGKKRAHKSKEVIESTILGANTNQDSLKDGTIDLETLKNRLINLR